MPLIPRVLAPALLVIASVTPQQSPAQAQGMFEGSNDIGHAQVGSTRYDPVNASYEIRGGGEDVWGTADDFRFTWTQLSGDAAFSANVHIDAPVTYRLSKGMLMFRQNLDPGSPYADVAIHADGHMTLQYRLVQGGETKDVNLPGNNAPRLRLVRHGDDFTASTESGTTKTASASIRIPMHGPVYVGLGVCAHNTDVLQTVTFSRVKIESLTHKSN